MLRRASSSNRQVCRPAQALVHADIAQRSTDQLVEINLAESPSARLRLRKTHSGKPWLDEIQFQARRRGCARTLKACLQPRISAEVVGRRGGQERGSGDAAELSDFALMRVAVWNARHPPRCGPVQRRARHLLLSKGLEQVERERQWPPALCQADAANRAVDAGDALWPGCKGAGRTIRGACIGDGTLRPVLAQSRV